MKDAFQKNSGNCPISAAMRQLVGAEPAQDQAALAGFAPQHDRTTAALRVCSKLVVSPGRQVDFVM
jgi:hypothetical protein